MVTILGIPKFLWKAMREWVRDRAKGMAPALAYYQLLSIAPLIGFLLFFSKEILGEVAVRQDVVPVLKHSFTPQMTKVIIFLMSQTKHLSPEELSTISFLSGLLFVWSTKEYFGQINDMIETIWNKRTEKIGLKAVFLDTLGDLRIAIIAMGIMLFFVVLRSLLPHPFITQEGGVDPEASIFLVNLSQWIIQFLLTASLSIFYFTFIPPVKVYWKYVIPGAVLNALLLIIGREIMEAFFRQRLEADLAESLVMVLLWFYYQNLVLIYSAECTKLYVAGKQHIDLKNLKFDES